MFLEEEPLFPPLLRVQLDQVSHSQVRFADAVALPPLVSVAALLQSPPLITERCIKFRRQWVSVSSTWRYTVVNINVWYILTCIPHEHTPTFAEVRKGLGIRHSRTRSPASHAWTYRGPLQCQPRLPGPSPSASAESASIPKRPLPGGDQSWRSFQN